MECKNPHCKWTVFIPVIEMDDNRLIGVKCASCDARYLMSELEIKADRKGYWNSVIWDLKHL